MKRRAVLLALLGLLLLGADRPPGLLDLREVRHWSYPDYTRVVVELNGPVVADELHRLGPDAKAHLPARLYLDLPNVWVGTRYAAPIPVGDGLLRGIRIGQNRATAARIVLDLQRYGRHRLFTLTAPDRVVIDIFGGEGARSTHERRARGEGAPPRRPSGRRALRILPQEVHTVVLDPGHGGRDPGAIGVGGLREKDLTLSLAKELAKRLRARGFEVLLTRDRDRTVSLEERTAFAEGVGADLFVSLHVNAARRRAAHGIETYYLDKGHERHALRVAARENGVPAKDLDALQRALAGLKVSELSRRSSSLAKAVHPRLVEGVRKTHGSVRNLGIKQGPFHVLFLSGMPSILVETGFITHPQEARRLRSRFYRNVLAEQIARGLSQYRTEHSPHLARRSS